jgi:NAD(P)H-hydrate epimerase
MVYPIYVGYVPRVNTQQMIEIDRAMIRDFRIELIQMMETAGRQLAHLARERFLAGDPRQKRVIVLAGTGGNGGGALVAARWLHNWGALVHVFTAKPAEKFAAVSAHQLDILRRMNLTIAPPEMLPLVEPPPLIVDGLIGYGLQGEPRGTTADLIRWANAQAAPILALDVPSGVETTMGMIFEPAIRATATMTLALPKEGFYAPRAEPYVGELYVADIGVPPALYQQVDLTVPVDHLFAKTEIIRLR